MNAKERELHRIADIVVGCCSLSFGRGAKVSLDTLNSHWQSDLQQRYNDARLELSQKRQNETLIAALKTTTATT